MGLFYRNCDNCSTAERRWLMRLNTCGEYLCIRGVEGGCTLKDLVYAMLEKELGVAPDLESCGILIDKRGKGTVRYAGKTWRILQYRLFNYDGWIEYDL